MVKCPPEPNAELTDSHRPGPEGSTGLATRSASTKLAIVLKCCAMPNADATRTATSPQPSTPQLVVAGPTSASLFLVVTINPRPESVTVMRSLCPDLANLLRAVGFRDTAAKLSCVMSFGSAAW